MLQSIDELYTILLDHTVNTMDKLSNLTLKTVYNYIMDSFIREPVLSFINTFLLIFILFLLFVKPYTPKKGNKLTKAEEDELINEWKPEPLVPINNYKKMKSLIVDSSTGPHINVNGKDSLNFASYNFLGIANDQSVKDACEQTIQNYGVGSCGPRGFYGTIDVHLVCEKRICEFYGTEEAILYSDSIACVSSVIPAFSKAGDFIICDEQANFNIQQGILLSRSKVKYFKHNDMEDLENLIKKYVSEVKAAKKSLHRQFIVVEGIYANSGDLCNLPKIVEIAQKYFFRIILDDSMALGVIGATGRGTPEHFNVPMKDVEIYCASIDASIASVGGFCTGNHEVCNHQRLSGAGYCFSASSPPYVSTAAITAFNIMCDQPERIEKLQSNIKSARKLLSTLSNCTVFGSEYSPLIHLRLDGDFEDEDIILNSIYENLIDKSIIVSIPHHIPQEKLLIRSSILVLITCEHTSKDILLLYNSVKIEFLKLLKK